MSAHNRAAVSPFSSVLSPDARYLALCILFFAANIHAQTEMFPMQPPILLAEISAVSKHSIKLDWSTLENWPGAWFRIRWGKKPGHYTHSLRVGDVRSATIDGMTKGTWYFVVERNYENGDIKQHDTSNEVPWIAGTP